MLADFLSTENIYIEPETGDTPIVDYLISKTPAHESAILKKAWLEKSNRKFNFPHEQIFVPHFRVDGLKKIHIFFAVSAKGFLVQGKPVSIVCFMAIPGRDTAAQIQLLQGLSSVLPQARENLLSAKTPGELKLMLAKAETDAKPSYKNISQQQIAYELQTSLLNGLSSSECIRRLQSYGPNVLQKKKGPPWTVRFLQNFFSFFASLLWLAALLCFIPGVDMPQLGIAVLVVILLNGLFSFLQEYKSDKAVDALNNLMAHKTRVVRDGKELEVDASAIVPGDLLVLDEGDIVPADARIISAAEVEVDNSSLTGESTSAKRYKSDQPVILEGRFLWIELPNILFAGSTLLKGSAKAVVFGTGMSTEIGKIANLTLSIKHEKSPLQKQLRHTVFIISALAMSIGLIFLFLGWLGAGLTFIQAFIFFIGIFVANVPEGLLPTVTLSLAMGVTRMAKRNAIVKNLSSVETLGCTTVICTDKTGTLTQNVMMVRDIYANTEEITCEGTGYSLQGIFHKNGNIIQGTDLFRNIPLRKLMECAGICNNAHTNQTKAGMSISGDPTEAALMAVVLRSGMRILQQRIHVNSFESIRKKMSVIINKGNGLGRTAYVKGAPLEVLANCKYIMVNNAIQPLKTEDIDTVKKKIDEYAGKGLRVLGFAVREDEALNHQEKFTPENTETDLVFLGLTSMSDPLRPEVTQAIQDCHTAGIRIIMITGDYPLTATSIAHEIGIGKEGEGAYSGAELNRLSDVELKNILTAGEPVFARVSPEQKLRIVTLLKELDEIVAVTGDGVNDGPALRKADIGIAMGKRGTDVAKEAAEIILTDDNFKSIVSAIEEGRAIFENIKKFASYIFNSNPQELIPFLLWILVPGYPLVMTVMGVLAVDVGTDLVPAMGLGTEPPEKGLMLKKPRKKAENLLNMKFILKAYMVQGMILTISCFATYYFFLFQSSFMQTGFSLFNTAPSPQNLNMAEATPVYLQTLSAFFIPTVFAQMANVLCKRSSVESIFSVSFLQAEYRQSRIKEMKLRPARGSDNFSMRVVFRIRYMLAIFFERNPVWFNFFSNNLITLGIVFELTLTFVLVFTDVSKLYFFAPIPWSTVLFATHAFFLMLGFEEARKYIARRKMRATSQGK